MLVKNSLYSILVFLWFSNVVYDQEVGIKSNIYLKLFLILNILSNSYSCLKYYIHTIDGKALYSIKLNNIIFKNIYNYM